MGGLKKEKRLQERWVESERGGAGTWALGNPQQGACSNPGGLLGGCPAFPREGASHSPRPRSGPHE